MNNYPQVNIYSLLDIGLSPIEVTVYLLLLQHSNTGNRQIHYYPQERIAKEIGVSQSTVKRAVKSLVEKNIIAREKHKGVNVYKVQYEYNYRDIKENELRKAKINNPA